MKKNALTLLFLFLIAGVSAQITITGRVTEAATGDPIPGVSIVVKGTATGTITDMDGTYSIVAENNDTLIFSFVGLETREIPVNNRTSINVELQESTEFVDEVVVVGYGQLSVKDLTSAITTVEANELEKTPTGTPMSALQGRVAGLQVINSGAPGSAPTIRVRGIGSFPGRGNENPLYVVDGMFFDNIDFLNTQDIESITVLKDASAAAIYGVRAANGVVLIQTKTGQFNQDTEITYNGYFGYQVAQNILKMANAEQFTTMALESGAEADRQYIQNAMQRYGRSRINPNVPDVNTDWYNEIIRPAPMQNHSINVSGGNEKAAYVVGSNYFYQEGILDMKNQFERFNLRSNIDFNATDWLTIGGNVIFSNAMQYLPEMGAWHTAYYAVPIMPVYDPLNTDAWPVNFASAETLGYRGGKNPFAAMTFNNNRQKIRRTLANFYAELHLIPDILSFETTYSNAFTSTNSRYVDIPYFISNNFQNTTAAVTKSTSIASDQIWDNILTLDTDFGRHSLIAMAGMEYRDDSWQFLTARGEEYQEGFVEQERAWYIDQAQTINVNAVGDGGMRQYGLSYLGRISYNYDDRYLLYATFRADGSSKYQEKWGYFPTVGIGWVISEEDFMAGTDFLDFLKLRASWGELGNNKVAASVGAQTTAVVDLAIDDELRSGTVASSTFSFLEWEVAEETNFGLTSRLFNSRLSLEADYFIRDTRNAVIPVELPVTGGT
ncbi:MAG: SusC/RagA family TonB-linked outer membrane protein, partial [Prolixibacteraceae bacterium]